MGRSIHTWHRIFLAAFLGLSLIVSGIPSVKAQSSGQWAPDQRISGYLDDTFTPFLVADQNRTVHAFASQWINIDGDKQLAIVYRHWSLMSGWTKPIDVLLSPSGNAHLQSAFIDLSGIIHVIFWGGEDGRGSIYYSRAHVENAEQSTAWSEPLSIGVRAIEPLSATLSGDGHGNLIVIYTGNIEGNGVYEIHSSDAGNTWTRETPVFVTYDPMLLPYSLELYMGQSGQLHAAWNVVTNTGVDEFLYYAQYDVTQEQWSEPVNLNQRVDVEGYFGPSFPSIIDNGENIIIMYNNGNPFNRPAVGTGRPVQEVSISSDGGQTWHDPEVPFYQLLGRSGEHSLVVDSSGRVHALFVQRIESIENGKYKILAGIWHGVFQKGYWSDPDLLYTSIAPHDVRAVVSQGNILLVVWREDPGLGQSGIWYSYFILDSPESPVVIPPLPAVEITPASIPDFSLTPTPAEDLMTASPAINVEGAAPSGIMTNPAGPLLIALALVLLILTGVFVAYNFYRNRIN